MKPEPVGATACKRPVKCSYPCLGSESMDSEVDDDEGVVEADEEDDNGVEEEVDDDDDDDESGERR